MASIKSAIYIGINIYILFKESFYNLDRKYRKYFRTLRKTS